MKGRAGVPNRSLEVGSPERLYMQSSWRACQLPPDFHASLRRSPATLEEETATACSEVHGAKMSDGCEDAGLLPTEQINLPSKEVSSCDMLLAPLGCAPITIPRAKSAWAGSPLPDSMGNPGGLRVWTPATPRGERRPGVLHAASQASSASGSAETPAGVRVGTPAWSAWRRRRDLLRASSQESATSRAETPAGAAEGAHAWQVSHDLGCAARAPVNSDQHDLVEADRLVKGGTLKRAHSEADTLPAAAPQVAGVRQSHTDFHGDKGVSVSPTPSAHAMACCMSCLRTGSSCVEAAAELAATVCTWSLVPQSLIGLGRKVKLLCTFHARSCVSVSSLSGRRAPQRAACMARPPRTPLTSRR